MPEPTDPTRGESKAARLMVLARLDAEGQLKNLSDIQLGKVFNIRRETAWKDRQALARAEALYTRIKAQLEAQ